MVQEHLKNLMQIASSFHEATHEHYKKTGNRYVDVPQIVGITGACENVDTLFRVGNRLGLRLFLTQTGQLALEQALQYFPAVYTIIHSGRDEEVDDERHLRQFRLTEEEFDWSLMGGGSDAYDEERMYEALLVRIEGTVRDIACHTVEQNAQVLQEVYGRDSQRLLESFRQPFLRILYSDAVMLLQGDGFPSLQWGDDLKAEHEAAVVRLMNKTTGSVSADPYYSRPVFIMRYPKEIKFFNMKTSQRDERVVLSADLILPIAGEAVGSAVREHDGPKLRERLLGSTMFRLHEQRGGTYEDFVWYLDDLVAAGKTRPHAGYGLGNERLLQYILGQKDIRLCSLFSLMAEQTHDWEVRTQAEPSIVSSLS